MATKKETVERSRSGWDGGISPWRGTDEEIKAGMELLRLRRAGKGNSPEARTLEGRLGIVSNLAEEIPHQSQAENGNIENIGRKSQK